MLAVAAGEFLMGTTLEEAATAVRDCTQLGLSEATCAALVDRELPQHRVTLDAYEIDRHEVTAEAFSRFVAATGYQTTAEREGSGGVYRRRNGQIDWASVPGASWREPSGPGSSAPPDHAAVQVSWPDAEAYCRWTGKRLPSEAEWERAARGTDGRRYPWGDAWDEAKVHAAPAADSATVVGGHSDDASPFQPHDMAGNVAEWVSDWYDKRYYEASPQSNPEGPAAGTYRVVRGGSWTHDPFHVRTTVRGRETPDSRDNRTGLRCARTSSGG